MPWQQCPACLKKIDVTRNLLDKLPIEGDVTACLHCGALLSFTNNLSVRKFTDEELRILKATDPFAYATIEAQVNHRKQSEPAQ